VKQRWFAAGVLVGSAAMGVAIAWLLGWAQQRHIIRVRDEYQHGGGRA